MKIQIGGDHHGVELKAELIATLTERGHEVVNVGSNVMEPVDYPDIAAKVSRAVASGEADRGILICGSGVGMSIAANKTDGIRAVAVYDTTTAELSRRHNDANVLCLSGDFVTNSENQNIVDIWLKTGFEGGRHQRRVNKIRQME